MNELYLSIRKLKITTGIVGVNDALESDREKEYGISSLHYADGREEDYLTGRLKVDPYQEF